MRPTIGIAMRGFRRPDYEIWLSATEAARAANLNVVTFAGFALQSPVEFEKQANAIYELIDAEQLDGVLLLTSGLGLYVGTEGVQAFCRQLHDLPAVSIQMRLPGIPSILINNYRGMREVIEHLIEVHGHRRLAFLRGPITHRGARERYRAYVETLEDHGIPFDPTLVTPPSESWDNRVEIARFLAGFTGPLTDHIDAIVGTSAALARQALDWLRVEGVRVPEEIALTGFDDFAHLGGIIPPLTTTHVPFYEVGRRAVDLLIRQMQGETVPLQVELLVRTIIRQSCGCPSDAVVRAGLGQGEQMGDAGEATTPVADDSAGTMRVLTPYTALQANRDAAIAEIARLVSAHAEGRPFLDIVGAGQPAWVTPLVDALAQDLSDTDDVPGRPVSASAFLAHFRQTLVEMSENRLDTTFFQDVVSVLRRAVLAPLFPSGSVSSPLEDVPQISVDAPWTGSTARSIAYAEDLLAQARVMVNENVQSTAVASRFAIGGLAATLSQVGHTMTTVVDMEELGDTLAEELPKIGIERFYLALYEEPDDLSGWARLHFASSPDGRIDLPPEGVRYWSQDLLPADVMANLERSGPFNLIAESLFVRRDQFGFALFGVGPRTILFEDQPTESTIYDLLRSYVSDALYGILLYDEAVRARQRAEEADRLKSRFLSMVSHELRTPLNLIVSVSEMLLWEQRGDQQELTRIHASAQHLDGLIRDVLDLASSQVGQLRLVRESLDLREALEVVILIGQQMASDKSLSWVAEIPDELPVVWGDRTRLRQVALNLVSNAFRFTSEGEVRLRVEHLKSKSADQDEVRLTVSDTGIGVPVDEQEAIFDEFRQSERTAARGYGGLGLGLAISRRLVEMHGGTIGVSSSGVEGEGASFYFTLPVIPELASRDVSAARPSLAGVNGSAVDGEDGQMQGVRQGHVGPVLVLSGAESDGEAEELSLYLRDKGYAVREIQIEDSDSSDGPGGWFDEVIQNSTSAVILGMKPASEQGWAMMKVLKENPATWHTPVLFYSLLQHEDSGSMLALDYLAKPVSIAELVQVLERHGVVTRDDDGEATPHHAVDATILLVDDEPDMLATHVWLLQSQYPDARILQASNGRQALELMEQVRPDLVLLDLMMPEMDGFEVIAHMQGHPDLCDIPIVVLTAKTLTEDSLVRLNRGVTAVLGKGLFSAEETLHHVETALRRSNLPNLETRKLVRRAMAYIHEHYTEPISRKEIAAYVSVSPRHLDRCFSEEIGTTPIVYLNRFRLRQARRLLQGTALSIGEIAAAVGFSDSSYFCRVFRRDLDMSPSDYRNAHAPFSEC